jgi:serine/threonine protein kinase
MDTQNAVTLNYPQNIDFRKAVQNPKSCFLDADLKQCKAVKNRRNQPVSWSGNFAIIFKLESERLRKSWAVRCFTQPPDEEIKRRYDSIKNYSCYEELSYFVKFEFLEQGIKANEQWYPIIKMEWQEGQTLDEYIEEQIKDKYIFNLIILRESFKKLKNDLQESKIAHGDLQHGNILITPRQEIKLVDYDEMYVPSLANLPPQKEQGHPNYQHPNRCYKDWGENIDDFGFDVILLSISALIKMPNLWNQFHRDDNSLIFLKEDFLNPEQSELFKNLQIIENDEINDLTQQLINKCKIKDQSLDFDKISNSSELFYDELETTDYCSELFSSESEEIEDLGNKDNVKNILDSTIFGEDELETTDYCSELFSSESEEIGDWENENNSDTVDFSELLFYELDFEDSSSESEEIEDLGNKDNADNILDSTTFGEIFGDDELKTLDSTHSSSLESQLELNNKIKKQSAINNTLKAPKSFSRVAIFLKSFSILILVILGMTLVKSDYWNCIKFPQSKGYRDSCSELLKSLQHKALSPFKN